MQIVQQNWKLLSIHGYTMVTDMTVSVMIETKGFSIGRRLSPQANTYHSRIMKLGKMLALDKTLKMMWHLMTLTEGQGHGGHLNFGKEIQLFHL